MAYLPPPVNDVLQIVRTAQAGETIERLLEMGRRQFASPLWDRIAEVPVFLGYSGVVLRDALATAELPPRTKSLLALWGFHDGDLYYLCRRSPEAFEVIARA